LETIKLSLDKMYINCVASAPFKGAMCNKVEYLLTEMQYDIHNYVFSGV